MDARSYLTHSGLSADVGSIREAQQSLWGILEEAKKQSLPATPSALNHLYQYKVPKLSADGSCSLHDELDPVPYDLGAALGGRSVHNSFALLTLDALVEHVHKETGIAWLGVYMVRGALLVKLAWRGTESRAEFPLTDDFEKRSTNVRVARSGKASHVEDIRAHVKNGGAYYECDPKVQSELCIPILDPNGHVVGIVDAEAFEPRAFSAPKLAAVISLALEVPTHLPR
ncbi:MAG: GAF domain-containing protein [Archangium sp.]